MKPEVLINANFYGVGGRETHLLKLSETLVQAGASVTIATRVKSSASAQLIESLKAIPVRIISTPFAANSSSLKFSTLWAMAVWPLQMRKRYFNTLYTFDISPFTDFLRRFISSEGKVILNRAGDLMRVEELPKKNTTLPDLMIVESKMQAAAVRALFPSTLKVLALPMLGNYQTPPKRSISKPTEILEAAFLGRFDENKGAFRLLNIWPNLLDKQIRLSFYGHGDRARLQTAIESQGLSDQVRIKQAWSNSAELAAIFEQIDFVLLASQTEGLPVVLLESIAHGVPFVATNVGAIRTLAESNPDVLVVQNDADSICEGIDKMARSIRSGALEGKRLQQFANDKYGYDQLAEVWQQTLLHRNFELVDLPCEKNRTAEAEIVIQ
ncbi:MAG TPA: glycosyltransferase family 4 protein [Pyrinomonadaceae bacterium]|nr:glycosyltransferase family 4 protein [Pyrinomonadaceae bacterium]